ncbi:unnamed protein product [Cyclocybe aegerita]|uniref:Zn(2)-C6 fungal-type domain-containing protein n=1 Tax=Cyclocybe aegerita TaxID=1973307 RepID=A0A8S0XK05_CYCAE|nr:unnamed protein product [Cyclocybe aegerita]
MGWQDSDPSDDENNQRDESPPTSRKRSSRACDQCRKTKSKCERGNSESKKCKSCALAGTACTFLGPSYKRGPPKGYIHAIEQRWHQVEALLGAILQCSDERVQGIVSELRQDDLAREILGRVDSGPYGPSGRRAQPADATKEDFFASIMKSNENGQGDSSRARRQSRVSREIVSSNQDHGLSVVPTKEWQDNLSKRLAFGQSSSSGSIDGDAVHVPRRRRLNGSSDQTPAEWNALYTIEPSSDPDDLKSATDGMGQLSLDEHQEIRFHGQASGLHILGSQDRNDDRIDGGVWRLPMARVWPPSKFGLKTYPLANVDVELPPQDVQDQLIKQYFTWIHPIFPVIHKTRFLTEYNARKKSEGREISPSLSTASVYSSPRPEPTQEVTTLLLISIFAIAARFTDDDLSHPSGPESNMWDAGCEYVDVAWKLLPKVFHISRPSTVQALLLLGYREFGIGSMEQGWIFIGTGIRMAFDLGLNCDSSKWKMHGHDMFSPEETQVRRQIWWACILTDRYGSMYMGRPIMIKDQDFETPLPTADIVDDRQPWQPTLTKDDIPYGTVPTKTMSAFRVSAKLAVIVGAVITRIYPIAPSSGAARHAALVDLESQLDQWFIALPEELRYDATSKRPPPPPQVLYVHVRYWGGVLLLHRAFIPNWKGHEIKEALQKSTVGMRAFDLAHAAACHIGALVTACRETFTMRRSSPFLTSYLLSASVLHILALIIRPDNVEANYGLQQNMVSLKEMAVVWPSAARAWELLNGVRIRTHAHPSPPLAPQYEYPDRNKRGAHDAFGEEKASDFLQREAFGSPATSGAPQTTHDNNHNLEDLGGVHDISTRLMAHMLGLEIPGVEPSTSYYPGYEWWPRMNQGTLQQHLANNSHHLTYPSGTDFSADLPVQASATHHTTGSNNWMPNAPTAAGDYGMNQLNYPYDFGHYGV